MKAAVEGQAVDNSSNIIAASNLPKPVPPSFSSTYIPPSPKVAASLNTSIGSVFSLSHLFA